MAKSKSVKAGERTQGLTGLFPEKFELRLFCIARAEYNQSSYGHGRADGQSAEVAVASEIVKDGTHSEEEAYEIAVEITARVIAMIEEEFIAIAYEERRTGLHDHGFTNYNTYSNPDGV